MANIEVKVIGFSISKEVLYCLQVSSNDGAWEFNKSYSQMRELNKNLEKSVASALPGFPPRKCCGSKKEAFVRSRMEALGRYFRSLCKLRRVVNAERFKEFVNPDYKNGCSEQLESVPLGSNQG